MTELLVGVMAAGSTLLALWPWVAPRRPRARLAASATGVDDGPRPSPRCRSARHARGPRRAAGWLVLR